MVAEKAPEGAEKIIDSVYVMPVSDAMENAPADASHLRLFLGYAGWSPGQLDYEIARGSWHVVPASEDVVFAEEPAKLWKRLSPPREHRAAVQSPRKSIWL
jgi:putative transcriptional regulator